MEAARASQDAFNPLSDSCDYCRAFRYEHYQRRVGRTHETKSARKRGNLGLDQAIYRALGAADPVRCDTARPFNDVHGGRRRDRHGRYSGLDSDGLESTRPD